MKFRTEIGPLKGSFEIAHSDRLVLIGSCFADNIGEKLKQDGFNVVHNPLGPLFNPESVGKVLARGAKPYEEADFACYSDMWHCLDFANRFQSESPQHLAELVNSSYLPFAKAIAEADVLIVTLGTSKVYKYNGATVGNCHKLPNNLFIEKYLTVDEVKNVITVPNAARTIFTLSPVRYPGEGLDKGFLAKAILRVAIDNICKANGYDYFPAFEIVNDDLRDYRFYAQDMKHPSEAAVDYIYEKFMEAYFSEDTRKKAAECRKLSKLSSHRTIIA